MLEIVDVIIITIVITAAAYFSIRKSANIPLFTMRRCYVFIMKCASTANHLHVVSSLPAEGL